jgi:hypothetical protein
MAWDWGKFAEGTAKGGMDVLQMQLMKGMFKELGRPGEGGSAKQAECVAAGWEFDPVKQECNPPGDTNKPDVQRRSRTDTSPNIMPPTSDSTFKI